MAVDEIRSLSSFPSTAMARHVLAIGAICAVVLALVGCGKSKPANTIVRGQILYRGEPVSGGLIVFSPDSERGSDGPFASAVLGPDGSFTLTGLDGKPIEPGWYRIAVAPRAGTTPLPTADYPYPGLPRRFSNPALSGLGREIKAGVENIICLDLDDS